MGQLVQLSKEQVERLRAAIQPFLSTEFQEPDRWRRLSETDIWMDVVGQVASVGGVDGARRLGRDEKARRELSWNGLRKVDDGEAREVIWGAMRRHGVRYVGTDAKTDKKTSALVQNLRALQEAGGPKKFLSRVAELRTDPDRIAVVCQTLSYIKQKGARDLLVGLGMCQDMIAFDSRIQRILRALGVEEPYDVNTPTGYRLLEEAFRNAVPRLGVSCLGHLDRILFQHVDEVAERLGGKADGDTITFALDADDHAELLRLSKRKNVEPGELAKQLVVSVLHALKK